MKREKKPQYPRILRSYRRVAQKVYSCKNCYIDILPGDEYYAEVMVCGRSLWVVREHVFCPPDPEEEWKAWKKLETEEWKRRGEEHQKVVSQQERRVA